MQRLTFILYLLGVAALACYLLGYVEALIAQCATRAVTIWVLLRGLVALAAIVIAVLIWFALGVRVPQ